MSNSIVISVRLNPDEYEADAEVLRILKAKQEDGYTYRDVITQGVLLADHADPVAYSRQVDTVTGDELKRELTRFGRDLISELKAAGFAIGVRNEQGVIEEASDDSLQIEKRLMAGVRRRRRKARDER